MLALAGDDWLVQRSVADDKALRELSEGNDDELEPPAVTRQIRLVVNPSAGKGRALEMLPRVAGTLRDGGADLEILLSRDFAEAQSMARQAIR